MCNCMNRGCNTRSVQCGNPCCSLGPYRASSTQCPPVNNGSIIPFSSGILPVVISTSRNGLIGTVSAVGFGAAVPGLTVVGNTINVPFGTVVTEAFSVPRAGNITAISAAFTETIGVVVIGAAAIRVQVYRAPAGSNTFVATNAFVDLAPVVSGPITAGTLYEGTANITNVPVAAGDRLVMVFSVIGTGITTVTTLTGAASAGITIS